MDVPYLSWVLGGHKEITHTVWDVVRRPRNMDLRRKKTIDGVLGHVFTPLGHVFTPPCRRFEALRPTFSDSTTTIGYVEHLGYFC